MLLASHQCLLRIAQALKFLENVGEMYYLYHDYLRIASNGGKSGIWMLESRWGGEKRSYRNKYKWTVPALFLKGLAGNAGTLEPGESSSVPLQSLVLKESRAQLEFPGQRSL